MLSKVHIQDHRGVPLCNVRTTRSIGIIMEPFQKWRELRQTAQCGKCFIEAKKRGWFDEAVYEAAREDFCQPAGYTGPYTIEQIRGLLAEADAIEGTSGKYRLNFGPINNPHSVESYPTYDELCAQMWAARLCKHPETAWFNNPADPGIVSNERFTREMFDKLPDHFKTRVNQIIAEDDALCAEGEETNSIDDAVANLLDVASHAVKALRYERVISPNQKDCICRNLEAAIEDVHLWLDGVAEANQTPAQMGWVGRNGRP